METSLEDTVVSLRKTVHYILLQSKKDRDNFKREDLQLAIRKLTKILENLVLITQNAPQVLLCSSTAKRLAFSCMKLLQVKHSGQNFAVQDAEFKKDVGHFKKHYSALLSYVEKINGKIPDSKSITPDASPVISNTGSPVISTPNRRVVATNSPPLPIQSLTFSAPVKTLSQPVVRTQADMGTNTALNDRETLSSSSTQEHKAPRTPPVRSNTVGCTVGTGNPSPPSPNLSERPLTPQTMRHHQSRFAKQEPHPSTVRAHSKILQQNKTDQVSDEWELIEKELLGSIEEDRVTLPEADRLSHFQRETVITEEVIDHPRKGSIAEHSDILEMLMQLGLSTEEILNASEDELLRVLEQSLLSDSNSTHTEEKK